VRGYKEKGNINTPLELAIENEVDRFSLAIDVIDRVPRLQVAGAHVKEKLRNLQIECRNYAHEHGIDRPSRAQLEVAHSELDGNTHDQPARRPQAALGDRRRHRRHRRHRPVPPQDATTNPSLIFKAAQEARYRPIIDEAIAQRRGGPRRRPGSALVDHLFVGFGRASSSWSRAASRPRWTRGSASTPRPPIAKARRLIELYEAAGVPRERVLIKIASTWEGIRAAERSSATASTAT
jgi:hypothetical protein